MRYSLLNRAASPVLNRKSPTRKPESRIVPSFLKTGNFIDGTEFFRCGEFSNAGIPMWKYRCPVCSIDKFVKAGLCSGVFGPNVAGKYQLGRLSCRCSKNYRWTQQQLEYKINEYIINKELPYTFHGWVKDYEGSSSNMILSCIIHEVCFNPMSRHFLDGASGCPTCNKNGFNQTKPAVLYVLKVAGVSGFTGFGITNDFKTRLNKHKQLFTKAGFNIEDYQTFEISGTEAFRVEKCISKNFDIVPQNIQGFKREATHYNLYSEVIRLIKRELNYELQ